MEKQRPEALAGLLRAAAAESLVLRVEGMSMGETIVAGSEVVVRATTRPPRVSEVWAFCNDAGTIVVHRFRRRTADGFVFRGDAQWWLDVAVPANHLVGRVVEARSAGGSQRFGTAERAIWTAARMLRRLRRTH